MRRSKAQSLGTPPKHTKNVENEKELEGVELPAPPKPKTKRGLLQVKRSKSSENLGKPKAKAKSTAAKTRPKPSRVAPVSSDPTTPTGEMTQTADPDDDTSEGEYEPRKDF